MGGNSHAKGSLSSIEKYEIDFDKWTQIDVTLKKPIHDMSILQISRDRILIFGGHTDGGGPNKDIQQVDLSMECFKAKYGYSSLALPEASTGGKTYFPPHFDPATGRVQLIFGYCDQPPSIEEIDIRDFTIYSAPPASTVANSLQQSVDDEKWKLNSLSLPPGDVSESSGAEERKKRKKSPF